ncbi:hypothetical protein H8Z60_31030 [Mycolicibacterium fortuitum]|nr:hypothetical protein [Mycolicibacterium fortuitum]
MLDPKKIIRNAIRCKYCLNIIESIVLYDYKECACGKVGLDGGHDYLGRTGSPDDYEELSEWIVIVNK